jgi:Tfp pilus assembly protein PilF
LYLAKIFNEKKNDQEEEMNLNNVLLLNPKNDEAIYMLTLLRIKQSNYHEAKELIKKFNLVCNSFCSKSDEMQEKFEKLIPNDAKAKN